MDTMISFRSQNLADNFLTDEQIQSKCPAAFLTEGTNGVSDKYVVARTIDVVHDLAKLGWYPVQAKQRKATKRSSGRFNFHLIAFQNPDVKIVKNIKNENGEEVETTDCFPQIILTNSMDGCCCFRFMVGLFRLVCSNGLVIATDKFSDMKIRHINYSCEDLRNLINKVVEDLPGQVSIMNQMQQRILTKEEQKELVLKMYRIRQGKEETDETVVLDEDAIDDLLEATRKEDEGDSLWLVFNRVQERLTKGLFSKTGKNGKAKKARAIKGFVRDLFFNTKIWAIAEAYLQA